MSKKDPRLKQVLVCRLATPVFVLLGAFGLYYSLHPLGNPDAKFWVVAIFLISGSSRAIIALCFKDGIRVIGNPDDDDMNMIFKVWRWRKILEWSCAAAIVMAGVGYLRHYGEMNRINNGVVFLTFTLAYFGVFSQYIARSWATWETIGQKTGRHMTSVVAGTVSGLKYVIIADNSIARIYGIRTNDPWKLRIDFQHIEGAMTEYTRILVFRDDKVCILEEIF